MTDIAPTPPSSSTETTFRSFSHAQGTNYAQNRRDYHSKLYQIIIDYHTSNGGELNTILDVGCGPGTAVRTLAPRFSHAIGIDPSEGMITTARSLGGVSYNSEAIRFDISTAEDLGSNLSSPIPDGSVDLITAATAAHWFNMSGFWPRAAQVLKPGGSVAIWTSASLRVHPSTPNYAAVQSAIDKHEDVLKDYMVLGNRLSRDLYVDLHLPWALPTPVSEFDEGTFLRKEWGTGRDPELGDQFFAHQAPVDLDTLELVLGTTSPVTRWREAHPDAVGTERDAVRMIRREIERALHDAGVEEGKEMVKGGVKGVLLMVKRKA
ncbi:S-adenosyl-L-methionine-dependent methyltransferase [Lindgomyces ingoldianus]|uniref:S-adenosyl-L-methionine-dependent methyltransferase n=1 Tax=Lindgomyces ingoldianus TaxID=673940 RepID=A0ACB6R7Q5_9PLEO|nr:S-adenosyl-L-methionine-dependent methyltransferase [Lindgomyces ingoldianus]KAF2475303.1 S-adenosyl-L-methionine-dependent methyltransferase [Lindgomyces ingoldianus]